MFCQISVVAFGICLACCVGLSIKYDVQFEAYCTRLAVIEGRLAERNSSMKLDDGGNVFDLEQQWKLLRRSYLKSSDATLRVLGDSAWLTGIWWWLWALVTLFLGLIAKFDICAA